MCSLSVADECGQLKSDYASLQDKYNLLVEEHAKLKEQLSQKTNQVDKLFSSSSEKRESITLTSKELEDLKNQLAELAKQKDSIGTPKLKPEAKFTQLGNLRVNLAKLEIITDETQLPEGEILKTIETYKLSAKAKYYLRRRLKYKFKLNGKITTTDPWEGDTVFEKSFVDKTFLADLLAEKFLYHLPLYRQHQRLENSGIHIDRGYLSRLVFQASDLLKPIYNAQCNSILESKVLMVDETKLRVGVNKKKRKMKQAFLVPMLGDKGEINFIYSEDRRLKVLDPLLGKLGTDAVLLTDGYSYYENFSSANNLGHAFCWSHVRRKFLDAENISPEVVGVVLDSIAKLYVVEGDIKDLSRDKVLTARKDISKPIVDKIFQYLEEIVNTKTLLPSSPLKVAISYAQKREQGLKAYLSNPAISIDTNDIEREIRPAAIGRKNWLFSMKEEGARVVSICYSLIRTCILQDVDPVEYLTDVLVRVGTHPASRVSELTPRIWKDKFAEK